MEPFCLSLSPHLVWMRVFSHPLPTFGLFHNGFQFHPVQWEFQSTALEFQAPVAIGLIDPLPLARESTTSGKSIHLYSPGGGYTIPGVTMAIFISSHYQKYFSKSGFKILLIWAICLYELTILVILQITSYGHWAFHFSYIQAFFVYMFSFIV